MKDTYYPSRSYELISLVCPALTPFFKAARYDQKRDDAVLLLRTMAGCRAERPMPAS